MFQSNWRHPSHRRKSYFRSPKCVELLREVRDRWPDEPAVVDGDIHDTWSLRFQSFPQDGIQSGRMIDAKAPDSERLRQLGQVRVAEFRADGPLELRHLFPPDAPQPPIPKDDIHGRGVLAL